MHMVLLLPESDVSRGGAWWRAQTIWWWVACYDLIVKELDERHVRLGLMIFFFLCVCFCKEFGVANRRWPRYGIKGCVWRCGRALTRVKKGSFSSQLPFVYPKIVNDDGVFVKMFVFITIFFN
ncbi:hypothetical protein OIU77_003767 [Salix suchowensis]|uniref:Transmembrane protein n=1 Tax=Salix suchowensis TaxID=1278906 RepID=A0ABQ9AS58_9ROSI|nr:hypothetical protein OIU77_003767 [Salix suchowensis]